MREIIKGHENYNEFNKRIFESIDEFKSFWDKSIELYAVPRNQFEDGGTFKPKLIGDTICFGNLWIKAKNRQDVNNIIDFKEMLESTCNIKFIGFDISLDQINC